MLKCKCKSKVFALCIPVRNTLKCCANSFFNVFFHGKNKINPHHPFFDIISITHCVTKVVNFFAKFLFFFFCKNFFSGHLTHKKLRQNEISLCRSFFHILSGDIYFFAYSRYLFSKYGSSLFMVRSD